MKWRQVLGRPDKENRSAERKARSQDVVRARLMLSNWGSIGRDPDYYAQDPAIVLTSEEEESLAGVCNLIQEILSEHCPEEEKGLKKRHWPAERYLRAAWAAVVDALMDGGPYSRPGEAKLLAANAGNVACVGAALSRFQAPITTLIIHGDLEYCTLLGHRLYVDLHVYFAALRVLAHYLAGNRRLTELVVAFTGCPEAAPDVPSQRVSELFAREVLPAFEALLQKNDTLRYVSFRVSHRATQRSNVKLLTTTSFETNAKKRLGFLMGLHPRCTGSASPLATSLPPGATKRILDAAFPWPKPPRVDFEYFHRGSRKKASLFSFFLHGRPGLFNRYSHQES